jgi:S-adenosylmethionine hydrolase
MAGVCKRVDGNLKLYDLTHDVPKFSVETASENLAEQLTAWPKGTVFVSVVYPGADGEITLCAAETENGYYIITPDNGTLTDTVRCFGVKSIRNVSGLADSYRKTEKTALSHGRDLAYCAACLASGKFAFEQMGPEYSVKDIVML